VFRKKTLDPAPALWIPTSALPTTPATSFYQRLERALQQARFGDRLRSACAPYYEMDRSKGGQPGIDPEVYFKMLMVGFFENIPSERGIAARCADSLAIRAFLHYELTERLPDHSTFTVIRQRLPLSVYDTAFTVVLWALHDHKLVKGKRLAIDTSVIEANAAMASLTHRLTAEEYRAYVQRLAAEAGIDPTDTRAVARFDRKRPGRRTSNDEWQNPHDPEAKIGPDKHGVTRLLYKPEHVVDLDTGAIIEVAVLPGDEADGAALVERIADAEERVREAAGEGSEPETEPATEPPSVALVTADMGYFKREALGGLQACGVATAIPDPAEPRRMDHYSLDDQIVIMRANRLTASVRGRAALQKRGETVERSFAHVLDCGGARRTTLRGRENILKRYFVQTACANLTLLLRTLHGAGTLKQTWAAPAAVLSIVGSAFGPLQWLRDAVLMPRRTLRTLRNQHRSIVVIAVITA
jgi:transposase